MKKSRRLCVRISESDYQRILEGANREEMKVAEFMRAVSLREAAPSRYEKRFQEIALRIAALEARHG